MPAVAGPSSARTSTARQSGASNLARRNLPDYVPRTFPLADQARTRLSALAATASLETLQTNLTKTLELLIENVGSVHENHHGNTERLAKARERLEQRTNISSAERTRLETRTAALKEMQKRVDDISRRMEESVRRTIDARAFAEDLVSAVTELRTSSNDNDDDVPTTTQSTFTPTDPRSGAQRPPSQGFSDLLSRKRDRYTSFTPAQRYASDNSYRQFRSMQHEMQHPDLPQPHESTWFSTARPAQPGETSLPSNADDGEEEDLAIARETVSTKCPITLLDFVQPVTSRKCPHSFERDAIHGLIASSSLRVDVNGVTIDTASTQRRSQRDNGEKAVRCPVPGCEKTLVTADLLADPVLVRKIARLQRAARMAEEEEEDDYDRDDGGRKRRRRRDGRSVVSLRSSDNEFGDVSSEEEEEVTSTGRRVKGERRSVAPLQL